MPGGPSRSHWHSERSEESRRLGYETEILRCAQNDRAGVLGCPVTRGMEMQRAGRGLIIAEARPAGKGNTLDSSGPPPLVY
jgi:hypothetical protein